MRTLIIDNSSKILIQNVISFAKLHPISRHQLVEKSIIVGDIPEYVCKIPDNFRVVFSFEDQPIGWCRHLSISIPDKTKLPSQPAVEMILHEFGFIGTIIDQTNVWIETGIIPHAISIVQIIQDKQLCKELLHICSK